MVQCHISTHTLTWSVTYGGKIEGILITISTHTLTWSVTVYNNAVDEVKADFNSHAHVERDIELLEKDMQEHYFNSHAHVERDCGKTARKGSRNHFNSHAHVERDKILNLAKRHAIISTHTLTWSVTISLSNIHTRLRFQLTRSRGA